MAATDKAEASRKSSERALDHFGALVPELVGGSADLTGSNLTNTKATPNLRVTTTGEVVQTADAAGTPVGGRHINYGVREFGMAAVMNGVALHGGYSSDFSRRDIITFPTLIEAPAMHRSLSALAAALLIAAPTVHATSFTSQAAFLAGVQSGYYLENFDGLPGYTFLGSSLSFSGTGFAYDIANPDGLYSTTPVGTSSTESL